MVDSQLPHAVAAKFVIPEIAELNSVNAAQDLNLGFCISQLLEPVLEGIFAILRKVVADFKHANFRL